MRDNLSDGWRLGWRRARKPRLQRFVLSATVIVLAISVGVAVAAVTLRRDAGPVGYAPVGLAAHYCLSVMRCEAAARSSGR